MENNDGLQIGGSVSESKVTNQVKKEENTNISIKYIKKVSFWSGLGGGILGSIIVGIILLILEYHFFQ